MNENKVRGEILSMYPTLTAFADACGWSRQKVSQFVSGERVPRLPDIQKIAEVLHKDVTYVTTIFLDLQSKKVD